MTNQTTQPPTQPPTQPTATVVITTKNRKEELRVAIASALRQSAKPEVLVIDDGSTDGTSDLVRREFPEAVLDRSEQSLGLIRQRTRAASLARGRIIFSIDDDAEFASPNTVEQTLAEFDHPRIAAVAIPFINVRQDGRVQQRAPDGNRWAVSSYIGTAHALRRELFLEFGGYRDELIHQGEEDDFCVRLYDAGYVVRAGRADPIHHYESPRRDMRRMTYYGRRNDVLYAWHNVPMPQVLVHLPGTWFKGLVFSARNGLMWQTLRGQSGAVGRILTGKAVRRPVRRDTYRLVRSLRRAPRLLHEIEPLLSAVKESSGVVESPARDEGPR